MSEYLNSLLALAEQSGLDAVGVASAEPFAEAQTTLVKRRSQGLASSMQFTYRNPKRSCDPSATLPGAQSLIVGALRYEAPARYEANEEMRVAAYAQRDYYGELRGALEVVAQQLKDDGYRARVVADDNALMDREAARRAGLGWYGKNTCLLIPKKGSRFVLGSIITTAALASNTPIERTCGTCNACQNACPTGALDIAGELDARKCLAWLLQAEGIFPREYRVALGNRFYGCDDCQDVCPINSKQVSSKQKDTKQGSQLSVLDILKSSDEELMDRFGRFYIPRRQPRYLRRNALLVLANTAIQEPDPQETAPLETETTEALKEMVNHEDPMLRAHGIWAAQRLGRFDLADQASCDPDARVREEARRPVQLLNRQLLNRQLLGGRHLEGQERRQLKQ